MILAPIEIKYVNRRPKLQEPEFMPNFILLYIKIQPSSLNQKGAGIVGYMERVMPDIALDYQHELPVVSILKENLDLTLIVCIATTLDYL